MRNKPSTKPLYDSIEVGQKFVRKGMSGDGPAYYVYEKISKNIARYIDSNPKRHYNISRSYLLPKDFDIDILALVETDELKNMPGPTIYNPLIIKRSIYEEEIPGA